MTGELPEPKPKAESAPARKETPAEGARPAEKSAPASATGDSHQEKKPKGADARLTELLNDLREAGLSPAELKTFKQTYRKQDTQQAAPPKPAAAEHTEKPAELTEPVEPKVNDFKTYDDYDAAMKNYNRELTAFEVQKAIRADRAQRAQEESMRSTNAKIADAAQRYGTEADTVIRATSRAFVNVQDGKVQWNIPPAVGDVIGGSPLWADLVYTLGSDATELQSFMELAKTNPGQAIRKIVTMEKLIEAELAKGGKSVGAGNEGDGAAPPRGEDGKFQKTAPDKRESKAPPPPAEVSGRGSSPPDAEAEAIRTNDFKALQRLENERDLKRLNRR